MRKIYSLITLALLGLASCNPMSDVYDDLDANKEPVHADIVYTLADADYATIASLAYKRCENAADSAKVKTIADNKNFSSSVPAKNYIPDFLTSKYPALNKNSTAMVTYNFYTAATRINKKTLGVADYKKVGGNVAQYLCFTGGMPANRDNMTKAIDADGEDGELLIVTYNETSDAVDGKTANVVNFEMNKYDYKSILDWVKSNKEEFVDGNKEFYFGVDADRPNFNLSKKDWEKYQEKHGVAITDAFILQQVRSGIKILLAKLGNKAVKDVIYNVRYATYGNNSAPKSVAYKCTLAGKTPEFEIVGSVDPVLTKEVVAVFSYSERYGNWSPYTKKDVYIVTADDFSQMGKTDCFNSDADNYLPQLLTLKFPYAQDKDVVTFIYKNDGGSSYSIYTDEYTFTAGDWMKYNPVSQKAEQFMHNGEKWFANPHITFEMGKSDYQYMLDWVDKNKHAYLDEKYPDTGEFYFGSTTYNVNINMGVSLLVKYDELAGVNELAGKSDEEVLEIQKQRLITEGFPAVLEGKYPEAEPVVDGTPIEYTIRFKSYSPRANWEVKYKGIAKGKFEYIEDSYKELQ
ncbi:hypothetical protein [Sanguibacteroides justesenii]|uniref:DUF5017 domain-containing protein n=1 Tax=Sanguibacteroides justesenii TaxID=1547597 RepID=A0AB34R2F7_9PORP|nr:hypothetical protein [Sanguibacteroides justesenii]KIO43110.1 hypothetical protein IE90_12910 [Sanguibacteroides justesenii]